MKNVAPILWLVHSVLEPMVDATAATRALQAPNFSAQYQAQFHRSAGYGCTVIIAAEIRVACRGQISLTRTSHPTIVCPSISAQDLDGYNYLQCRNTCQTVEECSDVFLGNSTGFIEFECAGEDATNIEAYTSFEDDGNSVCLQLPDQDQSVRQNFRFAYLGVLCDGRYIVEDDFFECEPGAFTVGSFEGDISVLGRVCGSGEVCSPDECTVAFDRVVARSNFEQFADGCVQTNNESIEFGKNESTIEPTVIYHTQKPTGPTLLPSTISQPTSAPDDGIATVPIVVGAVLAAVILLSLTWVLVVYIRHRQPTARGKADHPNDKANCPHEDLILDEVEQQRPPAIDPSGFNAPSVSSCAATANLPQGTVLGFSQTMSGDLQEEETTRSMEFKDQVRSAPVAEPRKRNDLQHGMSYASALSFKDQTRFCRPNHSSARRKEDQKS